MHFIFLQLSGFVHRSLANLFFYGQQGVKLSTFTALTFWLGDRKGIRSIKILQQLSLKVFYETFEAQPYLE